MRETLLYILQQSLLLAGTLLAVGCVAWRVLIAPRAAAQAGLDVAALSIVERRVAHMGLVAALALLPVWGLRLFVQLQGFRDPFVPISEDLSFLVGDTFWGTVWLAQGAVLLLLPVAFGLARASTNAERSRLSGGWWASGALTTGLVLTLALSSHAMGVTSGRALAVAADGLHALAGGAWIGSLAFILLVGRDRADGGPLFAGQLRAFSPVAVVCVITLTAMGVGLSWVHLSAWSDLWSTAYGRTLSLKVGVAGGALFLGLLNWRRGLPVVGTPEGDRRVRRQASAEVLLVVVVLVLTAVLTQTPKPGEFGG